jgi:hypothetical protein
MQKTIIAFLIFLSCKLTAQNVGIGNAAPTNKLHITATTDPLRLEGLQSAASTDSLLTVNASGVVRKRTNNITAWSLNGNAGTSSTNNFVGTTDNIALVFKTNNQRSGLIESDSSNRNNSFGNRAINNPVTGNGNNAFGYQALFKLSSGNFNIAMGDSAAFNITTGVDNIAIGADALSTAVTALGNIAIGSNALKNTVSSENIAIGNSAAAANSTGSNQLVIGANALANNQATFTQMAIGNNALQQLNNGQENIAIGYNSGSSLTQASYNVLLGHYALSSASNASNNTIVGYNAALAYTATGNTNNTFIGYQAALSQTAGNGNTFIGTSVDVSGTTAVSNSTGLGQAVVITASNQVRVGNSSINSIGGQVGWTTFSDARIKTNIQEDVHGLDFILQLRPVTYNYNTTLLQKLQGNKNIIADKSFETIRFTGLVAQEVEQAGNAINYNFSGVDKPANEHTPYGLRYAEFVVPMIKAIQEMKAIIDRQQQEIELLKKKL